MYMCVIRHQYYNISPHNFSHCILVTAILCPLCVTLQSTKLHKRYNFWNICYYRELHEVAPSVAFISEICVVAL
jgi:hypothetical protein